MSNAVVEEIREHAERAQRIIFSAQASGGKLPALRREEARLELAKIVPLITAAEQVSRSAADRKALNSARMEAYVLSMIWKNIGTDTSAGESLGVEPIPEKGWSRAAQTSMDRVTQARSMMDEAQTLFSAGRAEEARARLEEARNTISRAQDIADRIKLASQRTTTEDPAETLRPILQSIARSEALLSMHRTNDEIRNASAGLSRGAFREAGDAADLALQSAKRTVSLLTALPKADPEELAAAREFEQAALESGVRTRSSQADSLSEQAEQMFRSWLSPAGTLPAQSISALAADNKLVDSLKISMGLPLKMLQSMNPSGFRYQRSAPMLADSIIRASSDIVNLSEWTLKSAEAARLGRRQGEAATLVARASYSLKTLANFQKNVFPELTLDPEGFAGKGPLEKRLSEGLPRILDRAAEVSQEAEKFMTETLKAGRLEIDPLTRAHVQATFVPAKKLLEETMKQARALIEEVKDRNIRDPIQSRNRLLESGARLKKALEQYRAEEGRMAHPDVEQAAEKVLDMLARSRGGIRAAIRSGEEIAAILDELQTNLVAAKKLLDGALYADDDDMLKDAVRLSKSIETRLAEATFMAGRLQANDQQRTRLENLRKAWRFLDSEIYRATLKP